MEFRDLKRQYQYLKSDMDLRIQEVIKQTNFIQGKQVAELEQQLAAYTGVKHCVSCANGTDALQLALMVWNIGEGDAVFVPDFTFFSSGEVVSAVNAVPVFVDIESDTYNIDCNSLEILIQRMIEKGRLRPKAIIAVDLFGQPADYRRLRKIAEKYQMYILEDAAQGFGGKIEDKMACSFGDISTTSFFPAKPLGCYGDGGAIFTDNDEWAALLKSYCVHGKGNSKYDNVRIGMNSRLDTLQAAILLAKFPAFSEKELDWMQKIAAKYTEQLKDVVKTPFVKEGFYSSWAQYTIQLSDKAVRDGLQTYLKEQGLPSAVYYQKPMHKQAAFEKNAYDDNDYPIANKLSETVLSLPFHPYMKEKEIILVTDTIKSYLRR
ncbi:UDP-2-acetamido-2-deoxy-3-oxo-D-glucuronate aminotransferase [Lachnospiraceae bacterium]|nr:UDP-2-acetamido-2-deoxy-3-oxo-D-glucuronate aminotransferase [Lachnospiraceae bacterium]